MLILDSADVADNAEPQAVHCWRCQSGMFILAVGFSFREGDDGEVRWVSVGVPCTTCGDLWCCADWHIDYGPSGGGDEGVRRPDE